MFLRGRARRCVTVAAFCTFLGRTGVRGAETAREEGATAGGMASNGGGMTHGGATWGVLAGMACLLVLVVRCSRSTRGT